MIALKGRARIVPAYYDGPNHAKLSHLWRRPAVRVTFGAPIDAASVGAAGKEGTLRLTAAMEAAMKAARNAPGEPIS
jgi:1-acyl-sn-glycerol-3-phosphate acyltransferase